MCDTVVTLTGDGFVFAKNSDRDPNEAQVLDWRKAADHPAGATLDCTWLSIPQARRTHAVLLSRPFWMWGAEMGANEHGVVIGNEAVFTTEPLRAEGLTGMDLVRLGLERATSAHEAVGVITDLLTEHGQGGGCGHEHRRFTYHSSFLVADRSDAWVLETAGQRWATEQVTEGARSISNGLTIAGFADELSDRLRTGVSACRVRQPRTQERAAKARGPADLMPVLRDHLADEPKYSPLNGGMGAPCMHAGGLVANAQTTGSWVADLPTGRHWVTGTAAPCTSLFKPARVDEPLDVGAPPTDQFDATSLWWRHEALHRLAVQDPRTTYGRFVPERDRTELAWLRDPPEPGEAFAEVDRMLERWTADLAGESIVDRRPRWVRRYWAERNRRAALPPVSTRPVSEAAS